MSPALRTLALAMVVTSGSDAIAGERLDRAKASLRGIPAKMGRVPAKIAAVPGKVRTMPRRVGAATVKSAKWARANPKKAALLAAGTGAMIMSAAVVGPQVSHEMAQILPDTTIGAMAATGIGGAVAGATRSLVVNGGMQMVQRKKMDYKELATDVSLSAVGGFFTLGVAQGVGVITDGMSAGATVATNFVAMGAAEGVKDTYQVAARNKILKRNAPVFKTAWRVLPIEIAANALRLPSPTNFGLKMISDVVATGGYHAIVNEDETHGGGGQPAATAKAAASPKPQRAEKRGWRPFQKQSAPN